MSHGGKRPGAGRPATTASSAARPISFRLGAEDHAELLGRAWTDEVSPGRYVRNLVEKHLRPATPQAERSRGR
jgi:hypothetical protein